MKTDIFSGYSFIKKLLDDNTSCQDKVLEVGCGAGYYSGSIKGRYIGSDITLSEVRPGLTRRVDLVCDSQYLPFKSDSLDMVFSVSAVDYIADPQLFFRESHRILKDGGRILVITYNFYTLWKIHRNDKMHRHIYISSYIEDLLRRSGFSGIRHLTEYVSGSGNTFFGRFVYFKNAFRILIGAKHGRKIPVDSRR